MSLPVVLSAQAEIDVMEIFAYLESIRHELGKRFLARLREMFEKIDVRAVKLRKFQYVIYYVVLKERVEILAVLHGARDETAWKSRI